MAAAHTPPAPAVHIPTCCPDRWTVLLLVCPDGSDPALGLPGGFCGTREGDALLPQGAAEGPPTPVRAREDQPFVTKT